MWRGDRVRGHRPSVEDVIKSFADMKGGVAAWAAKQNETYNFDQFKRRVLPHP